jgi:hypothetical protein
VRNTLARVTADQSIDPTWNPTANAYVSTLAVSPAALDVGGAFTPVHDEVHHGYAGFALAPITFTAGTLSVVQGKRHGNSLPGNRSTAPIGERGEESNHTVCERRGEQNPPRARRQDRSHQAVRHHGVLAGEGIPTCIIAFRRFSRMTKAGRARWRGSSLAGWGRAGRGLEATRCPLSARQYRRLVAPNLFFSKGGQHLRARRPVGLQAPAEHRSLATSALALRVAAERRWQRSGVALHRLRAQNQGGTLHPGRRGWARIIEGAP